MILALANSVAVVKFSYIISFFFLFLFYIKKNHLNFFLYYFLVFYSITAPFVLGILDYKKYSYYESYLKSRKHEIYANYCGTISRDNIIECPPKIEEKIKSNIQSRKFYKHYLEYKFFSFSEQMLHRLIIWSYVKENIINKPFGGNGAFSSSFMNHHPITTTLKTNYELLPSHPHNGILQIWLELGFLGIILFLFFIISLLSKIHKYVKKDKFLVVTALISFFKIFLIGQISFGIWQSWWIAVIFMNCILFSFLFKKS